jgi:hypothetical protein
MPKVPNTGLMQDDAESAGGPRVGGDDGFDPAPLEKKSKDEDASVTGEPGADPDAGPVA